LILEVFGRTATRRRKELLAKAALGTGCAQPS
jgi:hypothetical protein